MKTINFRPDTSVITPLINMFNICPMSYITQVTELAEITQQGMKNGYLFESACDYEYAKAFLGSIDMKYNSTFYQTWSDVTNKSRLELLADQIIHYMTTYGTNFTMKEYVPNTYEGEPEWTTYKVIKARTWHDLYAKCMDMLKSGIALKSETVKQLTDYIIAYSNHFMVNPEVDSIKNREAMVILCDTLGILPKDGAKLFAHIFYKTTGKTMIVNNRETRKLIQNTMSWTDHVYTKNVVKIFNSLLDDNMIALASVFNRYKKLFLAFKTPQTSNVINKISRLSKKYHVPMTRGFWETVLENNNMKEKFERIEAEAEKANNFKLIQVMQAIREQVLTLSSDTPNMYIIRNGKVFIKDTEYNEDKTIRLGRLSKIYNACENQLIKNLSTKKCAVKFPEHYSLACPTSEKNFIGDFPMGTSCKLGKESVIGIYWRNDWGTRDFDLSYESVDGTRISWCNDYYNTKNNIVYSGDITNAPDGANEVIKFVADDTINGIVSVNRYNGNPNSKYRLFFGTDNDPKSFDGDMRKYMVDPNNIKLEAEINQGEMSQQSIGLVLNNEFYFYNLSCGYGAVKSAIRNTKKSSKECNDELITILNRRTMSAITLKDILLEAGFWEATETDEEVLDLTQIDRGTLIELFSK